MGIPDGAHTHGSGGGGLGPVLLVILAVALLGPAAAAAGALLYLLVIVVAVIGGLALAAALALVAFRVHRWRTVGQPGYPCLPRCPARHCRRAQSRGPRSSGPPRFICTCMACPPRTSPPFSPARTDRTIDEPSKQLRRGTQCRARGTRSWWR